MKTPIPSILAVVLAAALASSLRADLLVSYASATATSLAATSTAANVTATSLIAGSTTTPSNFTNFTGYTGSNPIIAWAANGADSSGTFAGAATGGASNYFQFTITPSAGMELTISSISFSAISGGSSGPRTFYVTTASGSGSLTSGSSELYQDTTSPGTLPNAGGTPMTYLLDSGNTANFSSLVGGAITTSQTFRVYVQTVNQTQSIAFGDIIVNGTVSAIPEPATYGAVLGAAALGLVVLRRRQKRVAGA